AASRLLCRCDRLSRRVRRQCEWLLHEHVLAGRRGRNNLAGVRAGWRRQYDRVDRLVAENGIITVDQCNGVTRTKLCGLAGTAGAAGGETDLVNFSLDR